MISYASHIFIPNNYLNIPPPSKNSHNSRFIPILLSMVFFFFMFCHLAYSSQVLGSRKDGRTLEGKQRRSRVTLIQVLSLSTLPHSIFDEQLLFPQFYETLYDCSFRTRPSHLITVPKPLLHGNATAMADLRNHVLQPAHFTG